jgi:hypothetical protein
MPGPDLGITAQERRRWALDKAQIWASGSVVCGGVAGLIQVGLTAYVQGWSWALAVPAILTVIVSSLIVGLVWFEVLVRIAPKQILLEREQAHIAPLGPAFTFQVLMNANERLFFIVTGEDHHTTIAEVSGLLFCRITNLRSAPATIEGFHLSYFNLPNGPWRDVFEIQWLERLYAVPDSMKEAVRIRLNQDLLRTQLENPIPPHGSIYGWVAYASRDGFTEPKTNWRIRIIDSTTNDMLVQSPPASGELNTSPRASFTNMGRENLSRIRIDKHFWDRYFQQ